MKSFIYKLLEKINANPLLGWFVVFSIASLLVYAGGGWLYVGVCLPWIWLYVSELYFIMVLTTLNENLMNKLNEAFSKEEWSDEEVIRLCEYIRREHERFQMFQKFNEHPLDQQTESTVLK